MAARVLRVFPDAERVDAALREASRISAEAGVGVVDASGFVSFTELVERLAGDSERRPCSPMESRALVMALAGERHGPFGTYARSPTFARAVVDAFEELKLGNAGASELAAAGQLLGAKRDRLTFLAELFLDYQRELRTRGWADRADRIQQACERLEEGLPASLRRFQRIELSALYDFPPARLGFVLALWRACEREGVDFVWQIPAGLSPGVDVAVDGLFGAIERAGQDLAGGQLAKEELSDDERPLAWLGQHLFAEGEKEPREAGPLELVSAPSARAEVIEIARRVRRWIDEGVAPGRIAVAFRNLGEEAEALEDALAEMGVRARARRGLPLASTAAGKAFLALPGCADDGFPVEEVAALLGSGVIPSLSRGLPDAPLKWIAQAGVRDDRLGAMGEKGAYAVRLGALAARLDARGARHDAEAVRRVLAACERLFEACAKIPREGSALALVEGWRRAIEALGIGTREAHFEPERTSEPVLRAMASEQDACEALIALAASLSSALHSTGAGEGRLDRRGLQTLLRDAASDVNLPAVGGRLGAVRILEARELIGQELECVALGGLCEGRFPIDASRGGLLSDDERFAVNQAAQREVFRDAAGEHDDRLRWSLAEDRLVFFQALASATRALWVSTARVGPDGQPARASVFFEELRRRTRRPVREMAASVAPSLSEVASERELRARLALEAAVRPDLRLSAPELPPGWVAQRVREPWLVEARRIARIEEERQRFFALDDAPPGLFSGKLEGLALERARALLAFGPDHPLSASTLGAFGNCRFRGLLGHVLRLRSLEEAGEDLDTRTRGTFWHAVLRELFPALAARGLLGRGLPEIPPELIDQALERAAREMERTAPVGHPALWSLSQERARAMVRRVLDSDGHGLPFGGDRVFAELSFGSESAPAPFRTVRLAGSPEEGEVYLRGSIDRFDLAADSGGVVDYKAKQLEASKLAKDLLISDFQLPFYLHAVRCGGHRTLGRAGWMSLRDATVVELEDVLAKDGASTLPDLLETDPEKRAEVASRGAKNLATTVHRLLALMRVGDFGPKAHDCAYCDFRSVCRVGAAKAGVAE